MQSTFPYPSSEDYYFTLLSHAAEIGSPYPIPCREESDNLYWTTLKHSYYSTKPTPVNIPLKLLTPTYITPRLTAWEISFLSQRVALPQGTLNQKEIRRFNFIAAKLLAA